MLYTSILAIAVTIMIQMCKADPIPEPGGHHHKIKIYVPYNVHSYHHHHIKEVPIVKEVPVYKPFTVIKEVPVVKTVPVFKEVPVPIIEHVPYEKKVYVPLPIKEPEFSHGWH